MRPPRPLFDQILYTYSSFPHKKGVAYLYDWFYQEPQTPSKEF